jgi:hypothetical protein
MACNDGPDIEKDDRFVVPTHISSYPSYASYVAAISGIDQNLEWLRCFLLHPWPTEQPTNLARVQSVDGELHIATPSGEASLQELLGPCLPGADSGMIFISYPRKWSIDRQVLDAVALKYELSPVHLYRHLYHGSSWNNSLHNRGLGGEASILRDHQDPTRLLLPSEQPIELKSVSGRFALSAFESHKAHGQPAESELDKAIGRHVS